MATPPPGARRRGLGARWSLGTVLPVQRVLGAVAVGKIVPAPAMADPDPAAQLAARSENHGGSEIVYGGLPELGGTQRGRSEEPQQATHDVRDPHDRLLAAHAAPRSGRTGGGRGTRCA